MLVCNEGVAEIGPPVVLDYRAPQECPDSQTVIARASALVRHQPAVPIAASATITREGGDYRLELHLEGGTQAIVSQSCESLIKTLTVVLALAVDPAAQSSTVPQNGQHSSPSEQPPPSHAPTGTATAPGDASNPLSVTQAGAPRNVPAHREPSRVNAKRAPSEATTKIENGHGRAARADTVEAPVSHNSGPEFHPALLLVTEDGMLPRVAHGPSLGLWVDQGAWSFSTTAVWLLPSWAQMPGTEQARGGHISFLGGGVELCRAFLHTRVVRTCAGIEAGDMMGKGSGVSNSQLGHGLWLAPIGSIGLRPKFWPKMGADLRLSVAVPIKRPAFGFDGFVWRFEPHAWSIRLASGFSWF